MTKQIFYTLLTTCMASSVAIAEPPTSSPLRLTSTQMDMVTAGDQANVDVNAVASSSWIARTNTTGIAFVTQSDRSHTLPASTGTAAGGAVAVVMGDNPVMDTSVTPTVQVSGNDSSLFSISFKTTGTIVQISAAMVTQYGRYKPW